MTSAWLYLLTAGLFEVGFTTCLKKLADGFSMLYLVGFLICSAISFGLLTYSMREIPLGTAYAVWTGIGAVGTALVGIFFFKDPVSTARLVFLLLLVGSIVGLKLSTPNGVTPPAG